MGAAKHGEPMPCLRAAPKASDHHSVVEARERVIELARRMVADPNDPGGTWEEREALRKALAEYDGKKDGG
jgi:hypothetical protein